MVSLGPWNSPLRGAWKLKHDVWSVYHGVSVLAAPRRLHRRLEGPQVCRSVPLPSRIMVAGTHERGPTLPFSTGGKLTFHLSYLFMPFVLSNEVLLAHTLTALQVHRS